MSFYTGWFIVISLLAWSVASKNAHKFVCSGAHQGTVQRDVGRSTAEYSV